MTSVICHLLPAWSVHQENRTGSLEVGKFADLILLDTNPFLIPVDQFSEIEVLATMLDGEVVYRK